MSKRRIVNVPKNRQCALARQFPWLMNVHFNEKPEEVRVLSVSVFDHWLSDEEGSEKLENVAADEQARRDALLADFCSRMTAATEVLSFVPRGREPNQRIIFRSFASNVACADYCRPYGGKILGHRNFHVVLPEFDCAFYESWDDTYYFYFTKPGIAELAQEWAKLSKVYLL